CMQGLEFPRTF
nr:immunoglobulin light chain junction region [Macaca mulatta]MOV62083.1 immunoglobulin light chain junction region [Macaca mulatta]MOV62797.1 immunoglobulin light chain junction region [Macaca mulatta]MOV64022.1 immunoglobulin light chain junction region [Macaca mulatta]MOV64829.1 immunoglobulin light chain junction region [Macaca mulatta]